MREADTDMPSTEPAWSHCSGLHGCSFRRPPGRSTFGMPSYNGANLELDEHFRVAELGAAVQPA